MTSNQDNRHGRHVVVVGGSFSGLGAAYTVRERLRADDRVTLISASGHFVFAPSLINAALGQKLPRTSFGLEVPLHNKDIDFIQSHVRRVRVQDHALETDKGEITYDRLIIATGGRADTHAIPGLAGEFRAASWVIGEDSAMDSRNVVRSLLDKPGPVVIGAAQGASYVSAAYEFALALDALLRKRDVRHLAPLTFVTAEPYLGHLGFGQAAARELLERLFQKRDIEVRVGVEIERVETHAVKTSNGESHEAKAIIIMPPFSGDVDLWKSAKLTDAQGMIPVNSAYQHVAHDDIYAAGVAAAFEKPIPPLQTLRAPHTGYLSLRMGELAGGSAAASLGYGQPPARTLPYILDVRVLDGADTGIFLASWGNAQLHNTSQQLPGRSSHYFKSAIERYLVWRLRTGRMNLP